MGVTEYDKASPRCVMVSVNGPMLANAETLLRSTIAHEIGHVVFDAPGWILVPPAVPVSSNYTSSPRTRDPRELRANEFMGALLVPPSLLRVDLQRKAKRQRLPASAAAIDRDVRRAGLRRPPSRSRRRRGDHLLARRELRRLGKFHACQARPVRPSSYRPVLGRPLKECRHVIWIMVQGGT